MKAHVFQMFFGTVHIDWFWSHIHVSAPYRWLISREMPPAEKGGSEPSLAFAAGPTLDRLVVRRRLAGCLFDCGVQSLIDDLDGVVEEFIVWWQCAERLDRLQRFVDEGELVKRER